MVQKKTSIEGWKGFRARVRKSSSKRINYRPCTQAMTAKRASRAFNHSNPRRETRPPMEAHEPRQGLLGETTNTCESPSIQYLEWQEAVRTPRRAGTSSSLLIDSSPFFNSRANQVRPTSRLDPKELSATSSSRPAASRLGRPPLRRGNRSGPPTPSRELAGRVWESFRRLTPRSPAFKTWPEMLKCME